MGSHVKRPVSGKKKKTKQNQSVLGREIVNACVCVKSVTTPRLASPMT